MIPSEIPRHRLINQCISRTPFEQAAEVVGWLGGIQGQDYAGAKWSIALRLPGATDAGIEQAISDRTIIRTWPMRSTLHFVAAEDVRWMLALLAPRMQAAGAGRHRQLGLDGATLAKSVDVLARTLEGGKQQTRDELAYALRQADISPEGQRLSHILAWAGLERVVCFGTRRGKQFTYTLLDEWAPPGKALDHGEALTELARRYFQSRGPATLQDYIWWSGLAPADARAGIEAVRSEFLEETVEGRTFWMPDTKLKTSGTSPEVYLLPGFDEYVLGYTDRSAVLDERYTRLIGANGMFAPTIILDGRVAGTWKRTFKKGGVSIEVQPFNKMKAAERRALAQAAEGYGRFLEMPVTLS